MGFLHKLWDETLAGPTPDSGLGRLRKYDSFAAAAAAARAPPDLSQVGDVPVTRSITILRTKSALPNIFVHPESSAGSSTPTTPGTPLSPGTLSGGELKRFTRRNFPDDAVEHAEPTSPTIYDWIMIGSLDT